MNIIELKEIYKIYGKSDYRTIALNNINLAIEKGDFLAIMGPSGSGKSTFLNILGCMDVPTSGEYYLNGVLTNSQSDRALSNIRNHTVSFIFQNFALLKDYSLYENIELPLLHRKIPAKQKKEKIMHYASKLGINSILRKKPQETSGGQQQRAAIARALVCESEVILADEPTGALDQKTGENLLLLLKQINQEGKTILIVTHDNKTANYANKIITINDGEIV
ncbi:ABC transporter ATP-binding protein [Desulfitobacterium chlororespirans]|uniref:Putative ABC transport system ATP-binding protein n=1 Tax=Desulfitobacterium chlororespirans DSM 11544 TaxID=1121395 RepID=A0A1M7TP20_9FIRM|nr:ABC transporter ATP-binding protein [Desulfitobacterium chlororespirans]SHN72455.1 putative ABC transport system ATP-binding protein [Desulfitobacterium chlororespirans DSM 11544]